MVPHKGSATPCLRPQFAWGQQFSSDAKCCPARQLASVVARHTARNQPCHCLGLSSALRMRAGDLFVASTYAYFAMYSDPGTSPAAWWARMKTQCLEPRDRLLSVTRTSSRAASPSPPKAHVRSCQQAAVRKQAGWVRPNRQSHPGPVRRIRRSCVWTPLWCEARHAYGQCVTDKQSLQWHQGGGEYPAHGRRVANGSPRAAEPGALI